MTNPECRRALFELDLNNPLTPPSVEFKEGAEPRPL
jgi:hypothetical protein